MAEFEQGIQVIVCPSHECDDPTRIHTKVEFEECKWLDEEMSRGASGYSPLDMVAGWAIQDEWLDDPNWEDVKFPNEY